MPQKKGGVSVKVLRQGRRKLKKNAFLVPLKNSNVLGLFERKGSKKYPIIHQVNYNINRYTRQWIKRNPLKINKILVDIIQRKNL